MCQLATELAVDASDGAAMDGVVPTGPIVPWFTAPTDDGPLPEAPSTRRLFTEVQDAIALCAKLDEDAGNMIATATSGDDSG